MSLIMAPATIRGPRDRWQDAGRGLRGGADVVVKDILASQAFYALHGPPGTGKTTVASHVVEAFLRAERGARLLISAQSNYSLDNLALRILSRLAKHGRDILAVRVASPLAEEKDKIDEGMEGWKLERLVQSRAARIAAESGSRLGRRDDPEAVRAILGRWRAALPTSYLELQERIHRGANLVFATCLTATKRNVDAVGNFGIYDWVIVEEAAKAWPTELAIPLVRGVRWALIGDHLQLQAHQRREVEEFLDECATSADEALRTHGEAKAEYARVFSLFGSLFHQAMPAPAPAAGPARGLTAPLGRLTTQFRMRPAIAEVISQAFYDSGLDTDSSADVDSGLTAPAALAGRALVWLDTEGVPDCSAKPRWFNLGEARILAALLRQMRPAPLSLKSPQDDEGDKPLAILTPYRQQKHLLKSQPMPAGCAECVHSVNEYQGHEANVVIASLVRDNTKGVTPQHNFGFLVEPELVNVMLSRARRLLVVVGRFRHFHESGIRFWRVVCETVLKEGQVVPAADLGLVDAEDA